MSEPTRAEHMVSTKQRALEMLEQRGGQQALDSLVSDLTKHPQTNNPVMLAFAQEEGARALRTESKQLMRAFIDGFR